MTSVPTSHEDEDTLSYRGERRSPDSWPFPLEEVVVQRYRLKAHRGAGGAGFVYQAEDLVTGQQVAVKVLQPHSEENRFRIRRECASLRLLQIPGVVRMLDEGTEAGHRFIVMDFIDGDYFPGRGVERTWNGIADTVLSLLEILAQVHAAGILHRDLKPSNVLVDAQGRPTILDFGLSCGPELGASVTATGLIVGTPAYLPPDLILGQKADSRTDLYSLGLMVYEALTGRLPHRDVSPRTAMSLRLLQDWPPIEEELPALPEHVAATINSCLRFHREARPRSAREMLRRLRGDGLWSGMGPGLPRLGSDAPMRAILEKVEANESVDLYGPPGSGRTRLLREIRERLENQGRTVELIVPRSGPFASLRRLLDETDLGKSHLADLIALVDSAILDRLKRGVVMLVDDAERLDKWSFAALERCRSAGSIVRVVSGKSETEPCLEPLTMDELRTLFSGPDRVFHIPEDAARALQERTGGWPRLVVDELESWVRVGIAHWRGSTLELERAEVDRLQFGFRLPTPPKVPCVDGPRMRRHLEDLLATIDLAWPHTDPAQVAEVSENTRWIVEAELKELEEHGAVRRLDDGRIVPVVEPVALREWSQDRRQAAQGRIAESLPRGAEGRLLHVIAAGDSQEVILEAAVLGRRLFLSEGRVGLATAAVIEGLLAARQEEEPTDVSELLELLLEFALSEGTSPALNRVIHEIGRLDENDLHLRKLEAVAHAALLVLEQSWDRGLEHIEAVEAFADPGMELLRHTVRLVAARRGSREAESRIVAEVTEWAEGQSSPEANALLSGWTGWLRYGEGRFLEAAKLHQDMASASLGVTARISALVNAASALLEGGALEQARQMAERSRSLSRECRHAHYEARAEWILRAVAYRSGDARAPDLELVEIIARLGVVNLEGLVCLNEAAMAWRIGELDLGRSLAERAEGTWKKGGRKYFEALARALAILCGSEATLAEARMLAAEARECPAPGIAIQTLGLLARAFPEHRDQFRDAARERAGTLPEYSRDVWREVLSINEAVN